MHRRWLQIFVLLAFVTYTMPGSAFTHIARDAAQAPPSLSAVNGHAAHQANGQMAAGEPDCGHYWTAGRTTSERAPHDCAKDCQCLTSGCAETQQALQSVEPALCSFARYTLLPIQSERPKNAAPRIPAHPPRS